MKGQNLEELSIYVLRELARRYGVSSPTSKRKEQLIFEITEISEGRQNPVMSSKFGRPPKSFKYEIPNNFLINETSASKSLSFKQPAIEFEDKDMLSVCGFIQISNNVAYLFVQNSSYAFIKCLIPATLVCNYKLKTGDKVIAEMEEENSVVKDILSINGLPVLKQPNVKSVYENISHILPFKKLEFGGGGFDALNIMYGETVNLYGGNNNQNTIACVNFINYCSADVKIYINLSVVEKNKIFLNQLKKCEMFVSKLTDATEYAKEILQLAIERAKRAMEFGYNVLIVVDDVLSLTAVEGEDYILTKNLMSLTKASKKGSITTLAVVNSDAKIAFAEKLADKRLKLTDSELNLF